MLETSVAGLNGALQRAGAAPESERAAGRVARPTAGAATGTERGLVRHLAVA